MTAGAFRASHFRMKRIAAIFAATTATVLLACACTAPDPEPAAPAAIPATTPAPPSVPVLATEPAGLPAYALSLDAQQVAFHDALLGGNLRCSVSKIDRRGRALGDFGPVATANDIEEMRRAAEAFAPAELAFLDRNDGVPTTATDRANRYFVALGEHQFDDRNPPHSRLVAKAWLAYFQGRAANGQCPLTPELLRLIDKSP
jgi:hypothetical protein